MTIIINEYSLEQKQENADKLEAIIDAIGLRSALFLLAEICDAKAEHLETNWQDADLARAYTKAAIQVERLAGKIDL